MPYLHFSKNIVIIIIIAKYFHLKIFYHALIKVYLLVSFIKAVVATVAAAVKEVIINFL